MATFPGHQLRQHRTTSQTRKYLPHWLTFRRVLLDENHCLVNKFILLGPSTFGLAAASDTNLITLHHQSRHDREIRPTDEIESSYDDELGHDAIGQCRTSMTF